MRTPFDHWPEFRPGLPAAPSTMVLRLVRDERHEVEKGIWCGRCSLPSVVRVPLALIRPDRSLGGFGVLEACTTEGCEPEAEVEP